MSTPSTSHHNWNNIIWRIWTAEKARVCKICYHILKLLFFFIQMIKGLKYFPDGRKLMYRELSRGEGAIMVVIGTLHNGIS